MTIRRRSRFAGTTSRSAGDVASEQAAALAAQLNQGGAAGQAVPGGGDVNQIVQALQQASGAQVNVEGGGAGAAGGDDQVSQLERLAKLKESGALTDAEFEREKARILGQ